MNTVTHAVLKEHLEACSELFEPPLRSYVDIETYSKKIVDNAITVEYWVKRELAGVVAAYFNDPAKGTGYITNVSVDKEYQGKGIASLLLDKTIRFGKKAGFSRVRLEVKTGNHAAIGLYKKHGFIEADKNDKTMFMVRDL